MLSISCGGHPCKVEIVAELQTLDGIALNIFSGEIVESVCIVQKPFLTFLENSSILGFHHSINKGVHLVTFDSLPDHSLRKY